jgi:hypothetical protein
MCEHECVDFEFEGMFLGGNHNDEEVRSMSKSLTWTFDHKNV